LSKKPARDLTSDPRDPDLGLDLRLGTIASQHHLPERRLSYGRCRSVLDIYKEIALPLNSIYPKDRANVLALAHSNGPFTETSFDCLSRNAACYVRSPRGMRNGKVMDGFGDVVTIEANETRVVRLDLRSNRNARRLISVKFGFIFQFWSYGSHEFAQGDTFRGSSVECAACLALLR
jgi:hypothetical protein